MTDGLEGLPRHASTEVCTISRVADAVAECVRLLQNTIKQHRAEAAQLLNDIKAEKAAAGTMHAAAKERASANLRQSLDALTNAGQQKIASLKVRLTLPALLHLQRVQPHTAS